MMQPDSIYEIPGVPTLPSNLFRTKEEIMNESPKPKTIPEQLRELRDAQQVEVDRQTKQLERAKEELKRLNKALKQWEPKE